MFGCESDAETSALQAETTCAPDQQQKPEQADGMLVLLLIDQ